MMRAQLQKQQQQQQQQGQANGGTVSIDDSSREEASSDSPLRDPASSQGLRNRAGESRSPYVQSHANTPVAWQLLDRDTLQLAERENKPIFMHIGFLADHLCRLTTQESFSYPTVASFLNDAFIPVLIDREERPDLDTIYQNYSEAVNATGGWPLNLFLTPDLYPIFGGTYWPGPGTEHSLAGSAGDEAYTDFLAISRKIHDFWADQEERCRKEAFEMLSKLQDFAQEGTTAPAEPLSAVPSNPDEVDTADLDIDQLDEALTKISQMFDPVHGGFGTPKFPNAPRLSFLLRLAHFPQQVKDVLGEEEVIKATDMALTTLRKIRDCSLRDHLGAGFMRFSVTRDWSLPHFEKMAGENALLLGVFLDAWLYLSNGPLTVDDEFADVVLELADYLSSPTIHLPSGGFASSEAADSYYRKGDQHMREGAYYLWTRREFDQVLSGDDGDGQHVSLVAAAHWNVREDGNVPREQDPYDEFINQNVLCAVKDVEDLSKQFGVPAAELQRILSVAKEKLRSHREKERVQPERDEKVVVATNGMVISALARTAGVVAAVDAERAAKYLEAAKAAARFLQEKLVVRDGTEKTLRRYYLDGASATRAFADDYAFLIEGLLDLHETTLEQDWLDWARSLQDDQLRLFYDYPARPTSSPNSTRRSYSGAFYSTEEETLSPTILRLKSGMDKSQPSTNTVSVSNLFRLGALFDDAQYTYFAKATINAFESEILQYPWLFVGLLVGVVAAKLGVRTERVSFEDKECLLRYRSLPRASARVLLPDPSHDRVDNVPDKSGPASGNTRDEGHSNSGHLGDVGGGGGDILAGEKNVLADKTAKVVEDAKVEDGGRKEEERKEHHIEVVTHGAQAAHRPRDEASQSAA